MKECQSACMVIKNCHSAHFLPSVLSVKGILREGTWKIAVVEGEKERRRGSGRDDARGWSKYGTAIRIPSEHGDPSSSSSTADSDAQGRWPDNISPGREHQVHAQECSLTYGGVSGAEACLDGVAISAQAGNS